MSRQNPRLPSGRIGRTGRIGIALGILLAAGSLQAAEPTLAQLDPLGPRENYPAIRDLYLNPQRTQATIERLWQAYLDQQDARYGEWAMIYTYVWWRALPSGPERIRAAQIGQRLSQTYLRNHPDSVAGHQWLAIHTGTEILARGVLDGLNLVPDLRRTLEAAAALDPEYFYGLPRLILAKVYLKLPPFPVSIGSSRRGRELLEQVRPLQEENFAVWHLFRAEAELLEHGTAALDAALDRLDQVEPVDVATAYLLETTRNDARVLRQKVREPGYNRYTWDVLLEPARAAPES